VNPADVFELSLAIAVPLGFGAALHILTNHMHPTGCPCDRYRKDKP
jgi:hypothetical protein